MASLDNIGTLVIAEIFRILFTILNIVHIENSHSVQFITYLIFMRNSGFLSMSYKSHEID